MFHNDDSRPHRNEQLTGFCDMVYLRSRRDEIRLGLVSKKSTIHAFERKT